MRSPARGSAIAIVLAASLVRPFPVVSGPALSAAVPTTARYADELFQAQARLRGIDEQVHRRAEGLARELSRALED